MGTAASNPHGTAAWAPASLVGRWSVALAGLAVGGTLALAIAFRLGVESADSFTDNWLLTGSGFAVLACGAASVGTGAVALAGRHDRRWAVLAATLIGLLVTALMLQQVAEGLGWLES